MYKKIIIIFLIILCEGAFLRLAFWQYERMLFKEAQQKEVLHTPPAMLTGVFDHNREVVLESQRYKNMYGYRVITPFVIEGTKTEVLIDRGWAPRQFKDYFLNQYYTQGLVTVKGVRRTFPVLKGRPYGPIEGAGAKGVRVLKLFMPELIPVKNGVVRQNYYVQAVKSNAGLKAFFDPPQGGAKHREYMLTWLSFALIWPILIIAFIRGRRKYGKACT